MGDRVTGQPHERNLQRWRDLLDGGDLPGLHRVLAGLDRDSIEMREVSPMSGLLPDEQGREVLQVAGWCGETNGSTPGIARLQPRQANRPSSDGASTRRTSAWRG
jgi:hypothetical protein